MELFKRKERKEIIPATLPVENVNTGIIRVPNLHPSTIRGAVGPLELPFDPGAIEEATGGCRILAPSDGKPQILEKGLPQKMGHTAVYYINPKTGLTSAPEGATAIAVQGYQIPQDRHPVIQDTYTFTQNGEEYDLILTKRTININLVNRRKNGNTRSYAQITIEETVRNRSLRLVPHRLISNPTPVLLREISHNLPVNTSSAGKQILEILDNPQISDLLLSDGCE